MTGKTADQIAATVKAFEAQLNDYATSVAACATDPSLDAVNACEARRRNLVAAQHELLIQLALYDRLTDRYIQLRGDQ